MTRSVTMSTPSFRTIVPAALLVALMAFLALAGAASADSPREATQACLSLGADAAGLGANMIAATDEKAKCRPVPACTGTT
jgi:hypothetical protein